MGSSSPTSCMEFWYLQDDLMYVESGYRGIHGVYGRVEFSHIHIPDCFVLESFARSFLRDIFHKLIMTSFYIYGGFAS